MLPGAGRRKNALACVGLTKPIDKLNITMGSSLRNFHLYAFFDALNYISIEKSWVAIKQPYYQDLLKYGNTRRSKIQEVLNP